MIGPNMTNGDKSSTWPDRKKSRMRPSCVVPLSKEVNAKKYEAEVVVVVEEEWKSGRGRSHDEIFAMVKVTGYITFARLSCHSDPLGSAEDNSALDSSISVLIASKYITAIMSLSLSILLVQALQALLVLADPFNLTVVEAGANGDTVSYRVWYGDGEHPGYVQLLTRLSSRTDEALTSRPGIRRAEYSRRCRGRC